MTVTNNWSGKVDEQKWGDFSSFHVSFLSYGSQIVQKVQFLLFCADLSKESKSVKAIQIYASESSYYALSENDIPTLVHSEL